MRSEPRVCESSTAEAAVILLSDRQPDLRRRGEDHQWPGGQTRGLALAGGDKNFHFPTSHTPIFVIENVQRKWIMAMTC